MPLNPAHDQPLYLLGRLAALSETQSDRHGPALMSALPVRPLDGLGRLKDRLAKAGDQQQIESVMDMLPAGGLPKGPMPVEQQGDFWIGYYHQRGYPRHVEMAGDHLEQAGEALYGDRWQAEIGRLLGLTDSSRIREMLRGARPLKGESLAKIIAELRQRSQRAAQVADELDAEMLRLSKEGQ